MGRPEDLEMGITKQGNALGRGCVIKCSSAALSSEFGMKMLLNRFPNDAEKVLAKVGVYSRGPRKGLPRGYVVWEKVEEGGWDYNGGGVIRPGTRNWNVCLSPDPSDRTSVIGEIRDGERKIYEASPEYAAANARTDFLRKIKRALYFRVIAMGELKCGDLDEFHFYMQRARKEIAAIREGVIG